MEKIWKEPLGHSNSKKARWEMLPPVPRSREKGFKWNITVCVCVCVNPYLCIYNCIYICIRLVSDFFLKILKGKR